MSDLVTYVTTASDEDITAFMANLLHRGAAPAVHDLRSKRTTIVELTTNGPRHYKTQYLFYPQYDGTTRVEMRNIDGAGTFSNEPFLMWEVLLFEMKRSGYKFIPVGDGQSTCFGRAMAHDSTV